MLWLAIHFPHLPLESILRASCSADQPHAVVDAEGVAAANKAARQRGIGPGMRLAAAYALCPDLQVCRRNGEAEQDALRGVATWIAQFTPSVAIQGDGQIVLELEASLKLFGGLQKILALVRSGLAAIGLTGIAASAPTAMGARCLALAGKECHAENRDALARMLRLLPLGVLAGALALDEKAMAMLHAIGIRTIADVEALPRDGFARRFGPGLLRNIDRAFGRCAETHDFFVLPQRFAVRLELPHSTDAAEALLFAANRLFVQLEAFLRARAGAAERIVLRLDHEDFPQTEVSIQFVAASRSARHFVALARERLARLALPGPVQSISLEAPAVQSFAMHEESLFPDAAGIPEEWERLIERLQARLGADAVFGIATADDYRPERASLEVKIGSRSSRVEAHGPAQRPLWLLREPKAIVEPDRGGLTLLAGPERIESGWWDGGDIARDYFIAQSEHHALLWIYCRKGLEPCWFLHGVFS